jgi:chromosome segregation ATPase
MEKLFLCSGRVVGANGTPERETQRLAGEAGRHAKATVSRSLEANSKHFHEAREKLEMWADDMVLSAEKALADTKEQIKAVRRQARQAVTLEEQHQIQEKIQKLERQQRRQRQEIFKVEDEIMDKRDQLIDQLEKRLAQRTTTETLFTIRWAVV